MGIKATGFVGFTRRGRGIESQTEYVKFNSGATPGAGDSDWKTKSEREAQRLITAPTDAYPYMWKKTVTKWTSGESTVTIELVCVKGKDGTDGKRGVYIPQPKLWSEYPDDYHFEAGVLDSETRIDVVLHEKNGRLYAYACKGNHTKSANFEPETGAWSSLVWESGMQWSFIATRMLLAEFARVENLCAEFIRMLDAEGNIIFEAANGDVTCNRGRFRDVDIEGKLLSGDPDGKHVEVNPTDKVIRIFDEGGSLCAELDGSAWTSAQLKPGSSGGSVSVTTAKATLTANGTGMTSVTTQKDVTGSYETKNPGAIRIQATASLSMTVSGVRAAGSTGFSGETIEKPTMAQQAEFYCVVTTRNAAGTVINTVRRHIVGWAQRVDGAAHSESATKTFTVAVPAGKHTVGYELRAAGSTATATVDTGSVTYVADWFMARYFSNGFALTQNTLNYLIGLYESGVMKLMLGGDFYIDEVKQPRTVYVGTVTDSTNKGSEGATKSDLIYPGSTSGVTLTKGASTNDGYTLTFPAKYGLTTANALIELTGIGNTAGSSNSPVKASIKSKSAGSGGAFTVVVWISDDDTTNFGSFQIKVSRC